MKNQDEINDHYAMIQYGNYAIYKPPAPKGEGSAQRLH